MDEKKEKGMFIITASHQLELHQAISQSLAGRTAILKLLPLSLSELSKAHFDLSLDDYLLKGAFPRIYHDQLEPTKAYRNYFQTYIERDVRQLIHVKDLMLFQRFMKLCAGRVGQILNVHNLSNDLGISSHTVKNWLSVLEASFLIFQLPPYFENFGKRVIKSPKIFFTDTGLASYLLDIENTTQLNRDPLRGHLIENLIVLELLKYRLNRGFDPQLYYYRDSNQNEVDVIYKTGHLLIPIEIKAAQTFNQNFLRGLKYFKTLVGDRCSKGYVIYTGDHGQNVEDFKIINYQNTSEVFE